jgi:cyclophilin family peptidyl-prolyl cis-trans isomerase
MTIDQNKTYTATINTNFGDIVVQLLPKEAPLAVNNFVFLSRQGFYKGVKFHRIINGFMMQGGDPTGTGGGGPGYRFADEKVTRNYVPGTLAMANAGPNTNGSQFFIMLADYPLPKNYTIFGLTTSGMDVVKKIGDVPKKMGSDGAQSSPTVDVHINDITIQEK